VQVLTTLANGARASYHFSGVVPFARGVIYLHGSNGALCYDFLADQIHGASKAAGSRLADLAEIPIPPDQARAWNVEADFIAAIRDGKPIEFTTFEAGVAYMEFTEAVALSAEMGEEVELPLSDVE
jgi:predicted dehydrogenase